MHRRTVLTFLFVALPLMGQSLPKASTQDESLLIGPGDQLHVEVYDTPQFDQHPHVDDAGNAPLLFLGDVALMGDTPGQAAKAIEDRMVSAGLMHHPQVSVTIEQYATQDVSVLGQVSKPGPYPIRTPRSILDVLSMAGGLTLVADRNVLVLRHGLQVARESYFVSNAPDQHGPDLKIYPGDTIVVAKVNLVYVLGDVARPGGFPMTSNDSAITLLQTIAEAGSTNKTAVLSGAKLLRKSNGSYSVVQVDLGKVLRGKAPDMPLQADDVLFVPFSYSKNFLLSGTAIATSVAAAAVFIP
jgi:polysaccharide biosynthesis/export protein